MCLQRRRAVLLYVFFLRRVGDGEEKIMFSQHPLRAAPFIHIVECAEPAGM